MSETSRPIISSISPGYALWLSLWQIDLVQHRQHFQALLNGGVTVGDTLGLDPLGRIHD
jgi:hypothetical protein